MDAGKIIFEELNKWVYNETNEAGEKLHVIDASDLHEIIPEIVKKLNKPAVSVVQEPIVVGAVCPHFQECINGGKNQYCDLQTLNELDCFIGQNER